MTSLYHKRLMSLFLLDIIVKFVLMGSPLPTSWVSFLADKTHAVGFRVGAGEVGGGVGPLVGARRTVSPLHPPPPLPLRETRFLKLMPIGRDKSGPYALMDVF